MSRRAKILIVDDSLFVRRQTADILQSAGFEPLHEPDAFVALDRVAAEAPDCVLFDLRQRAPNARAFIDGLRRRHLETPVVVTGVDTDALSPRDCELLGAAGFILKPIQTDALIETVERAITVAEWVV